MVKIFIGNVAPGSEEGQLRVLFEEYGPVSECAVVGNYAFVHMDEMSQAEQAIQAINGKTLNGNQLSVELSHGKKRDSAGGPMRRGGGMNGTFRGRGGPPRPPMLRGGIRPGPPGFRPRPWEIDPYGAPAPFPPRGPMGPPPPRGNFRGGPPGRGMGPRGMPPPPARGARFPPRSPGPPPRGAMRGGRGSFGPRPPPPNMYGPPPGYVDDGSGMMYPPGPAGADPSAMYDDGSGAMAGGAVDYYSAMPGADPNGAPVDPSAAVATGEYDYYAAVPPGMDYGVQDPNMVAAAGPGMVYDNYSTAEYGTEVYDQSAYYGEYAYDYSQDPNYAAPAANGVRYNPYAAQ